MLTPSRSVFDPSAAAPDLTSCHSGEHASESSAASSATPFLQGKTLIMTNGVCSSLTDSSSSSSISSAAASQHPRPAAAHLQSLVADRGWCVTAYPSHDLPLHALPSIAMQSFAQTRKLSCFTYRFVLLCRPFFQDQGILSLSGLTHRHYTDCCGHAALAHCPVLIVPDFRARQVSLCIAGLPLLLPLTALARYRAASGHRGQPPHQPCPSNWPECSPVLCHVSLLRPWLRRTQRRQWHGRTSSLNAQQQDSSKLSWHDSLLCMRRSGTSP